MRQISARAQGPAIVLFVGLGYYAGAYLGVTQTVTDEGIALIWPPNAVYVLVSGPLFASMVAALSGAGRNRVNLRVGKCRARE